MIGMVIENLGQELLFGGIDEKVGPSSARSEADNTINDTSPRICAALFSVELGLELFSKFFRR